MVTKVPTDAHPIYDLLLRLVHEYRFVTTSQLMRLTRERYQTERSALRQTLRHLRTLRERHLVTSLERRVGGWQGGSQITIWTITTTGRRLLTGNRARVLPYRYSTTFLEHQLAVTETQVLLHETAHQHALQIVAEAEPASWRRSLDVHGSTVTLKPDLSVTVTSSEFIDRYFLEIDRATENPARVMRKCWQYQRYRQTGIEQGRQDGVFPAVVWIVPHEQRKTQLQQTLNTELQLQRELFTVITPDELTALIRDGPTGT